MPCQLRSFPPIVSFWLNLLLPFYLLSSDFSLTTSDVCRHFLWGWQVSPERTARAFCQAGQGPANLAANIQGVDGARTSVSLIGVQAASQTVHLGASRPFRWAWGPQSRGISGQFPQRAKLPSFGARFGVGIFMLLGGGRVPGVPLLAFSRSSHPYNQSRLVPGTPVFPGASSLVLWLDSCWVSIFSTLLSWSPLAHVPFVLQRVDTSRPLSSPLSFPCHSCPFSSFIIILKRLGKERRSLS